MVSPEDFTSGRVAVPSATSYDSGACGSYSSLDFPRGCWDLVHFTSSLVGEDATVLFFHRRTHSPFYQRRKMAPPKGLPKVRSSRARHTRLLEDVIWKIDLPKDRRRCQRRVCVGGGAASHHSAKAVYQKPEQKSLLFFIYFPKDMTVSS